MFYLSITQRQLRLLPFVALSACISVPISQQALDVTVVNKRYVIEHKCEMIAPVKSTSALARGGAKLGFAEAKRGALHQAGTLNATHIIWLSVSSHILTTAKGEAYRCPTKAYASNPSSKGCDLLTAANLGYEGKRHDSSCKKISDPRYLYRYLDNLNTALLSVTSDVKRINNSRDWIAAEPKMKTDIITAHEAGLSISKRLKNVDLWQIYKEAAEKALAELK